MNVSLIVTVLNEARSLPTLLDSIAAQTRPPDEVVICDGGSTDSTPDVLRAETRLPLRVIERPGCNIAQGRNAAIEAATGDVIAATDAGVRLDPQWLAKLIEPVGPAGRWSHVAGFFRPDDAHTSFEMAMGATVLPQLHEIDPAKFLPSSRSVAFTKAAWQAVGGYPEWLDYCEDLIFDFKLRDQFGAFAFAPEAVAYFQPRSSLKSFFQQYYRYARGDGRANLWPQRHFIRYATYLIALPAIAWLTAKVNPGFALLYVVGAAIYLQPPYQRLAALPRPPQRTGQLKAIGWIPIIRVTGDLAKMIGYPVGIVRRGEKRGPHYFRVVGKMKLKRLRQA